MKKKKKSRYLTRLVFNLGSNSTFSDIDHVTPRLKALDGLITDIKFSTYQNHAISKSSLNQLINLGS